MKEADDAGEGGARWEAKAKPVGLSKEGAAGIEVGFRTGLSKQVYLGVGLSGSSLMRSSAESEHRGGWACIRRGKGSCEGTFLGGGRAKGLRKEVS